MVIARKEMRAGLNYGELNSDQIKLFLALLDGLKEKIPKARTELEVILTSADSAEKGYAARYLYEEGVNKILAEFRELRKLLDKTLKQFPEFEANLQQATH